MCYHPYAPIPWALKLGGSALTVCLPKGQAINGKKRRSPRTMPLPLDYTLSTWHVQGWRALCKLASLLVGGTALGLSILTSKDCHGCSWDVCGQGLHTWMGWVVLHEHTPQGAGQLGGRSRMLAID